MIKSKILKIFSILFFLALSNSALATDTATTASDVKNKVEETIKTDAVTEEETVDKESSTSEEDEDEEPDCD